MAFERRILPAEAPSSDELSRAMAGIGIRISAEPDVDANIEDTLLFASIEGMEDDDLRTLSLVVTWLAEHSARLNADRLVRVIGAQESPRVRAFWSAVGHWLGDDRRLTRLRAVYDGPRVDLVGPSTDFLIARHGEDSRFEGGPLRVPASTLRDRPVDVLSASELAARHMGYRQRLIIGPSYRADVWTVVVRNSTLSTAELARRAYASFATAWQVRKDFETLYDASVVPESLSVERVES